MKLLGLLLLILSWTTVAIAQKQTILSTKYESLFPKGTGKGNWYAKESFGGHNLQLVIDPKEAWKTRMNMVKSARRSILFSTFIYDADETSNAFSDLLCVKAKVQGLDVRMMVDSWGGPKFHAQQADKLRKCGVGVIEFNPGKWNLLKLVQAMHEKLLIIDGEKVLLGSRGIQNSYFHVSPAHKFFHDIELVIEGPLACWWQFKFIDNYHSSRLQDRPKEAMGMWEEAIKLDESLYGKLVYPTCYPISKGKQKLVPLYGNPFFKPDQRPIEDMYLRAIDSLPDGSSLKFYSPYFVPTKRFGEALVRAKQDRGMKIQILTNSINSNDEGVAPLVAMSYEVEYIRKAGIDIHLYRGPNTLHRKAGIYNSKYIHLGSDNLDNRGQRWETESVIMTDEKNIVETVEAEFDADWEHSDPLTDARLLEIKDAPDFMTHFLSKNLRELF